jgi:hypothetical protein
MECLESNSSVSLQLLSGREASPPSGHGREILNASAGFSSGNSDAHPQFKAI